MFDVGFWELAIIGVVALVIVGPERLPGLARTAGLWVGKGRRMLADVKRDIDREIKSSEMADLSELKKDFEEAGKEVEKAGESIKAESGVDDLKNTFKDASPLKEDLASELDEIDQVSKQFNQELSGAKSSESGNSIKESTAEPKTQQTTEQTTEQTTDLTPESAADDVIDQQAKAAAELEQINSPEKGAA